MTNSLIPWLLKAVWVPCFLAVIFCSVGVAIFIFKEAGWEVPFRWLCIAGLAAYFTDKWISV